MEGFGWGNMAVMGFVTDFRALPSARGQETTTKLMNLNKTPIEPPDTAYDGG